MDTQINVTFTLTKDELENLCAALHESTFYWCDHRKRAETEAEYFLSTRGSTLVYEQRAQMYKQFKDIYYDTFDPED